MKRLVAILCTAATVFTMAASAIAAPSIGTFDYGDATVDASGTTATIPEGKKVAVQEATPDNYADKKVADAVKLLNGDEPTSLQDIFDVLEFDAKDVKTTDGKEIDPKDYDPITKFADLVITDGTKAEYTIDGKVKVTVKVEDVLKDVKAEDLLIMQVDPTTGEVFFVEVTDVDPETGEITAVFPCLGPFTILEKTAA